MNDLASQNAKLRAKTDATMDDFNALSAKMDALARERMNAEIEAQKTRLDAQTAAVNTLTALARDVMKTAWAKIAPGFSKIETATGFSFTVLKDENGNAGEPIAVFGRPKVIDGKSLKASGGNGGGAGGAKAAMTVSKGGKTTTYESAAEAKRAVLPANKHDVSMSWNSVASAAKSLGYTVAPKALKAS